jgi:hypothetical protein
VRFRSEMECIQSKTRQFVCKGTAFVFGNPCIASRFESTLLEINNSDALSPGNFVLFQ